MNTLAFTKTLRASALCFSLLLLASCAKDASKDSELESSESQTAQNTTTTTQPRTSGNTFTLPLLDAFFADSAFAKDLRSNIALSDQEVTKLRQAASEEAAKESQIAEDDYAGRTRYAEQIAEQRATEIIGVARTAKLADFISTRWYAQAQSGVSGSSSGDSNIPSGTYNSVPSDTRIVVNAPAARMDLFKEGTLVRSYSIAIGVPEFPLPTGMRKASEIIFNPSWTAPDESWVESSTKVKVGEKVAPGSKLNPLGLAKIPIGSPSLIHGGKTDANLGTFGSHGCVGLTDKQLRLFITHLATLSGDSLSDKNIAEYTKDKKTSKSVKLGEAIPVELRYETMVVENGDLHIYQDVYGRGTNTKGDLKALLQQYGVRWEQLSDSERVQVDSAIQKFGIITDSLPTTASVTGTDTSKAARKKTATPTKAKSRKIQKMTIQIAALAGKGYPAAILEEKPAKAKPVAKKS